MTFSDAKDQPKRLGDFEIIRELGRGGMGVVYEARQRSLNRHVALKVLSTGLGLTSKAVMRFKREAEAAAKLHHTNIVPIYSTGDEGRVPYYAMELIDGPSLDLVISHLRHGTDDPPRGSLDSTHDASPDQQVADWANGTIGLAVANSGSDGATSTSASSSYGSSSFGSGDHFFDNVARMMSGVADALAHAHDQGVIHRDIKPSNLLLSPDGRLSINDFGLARMLEQPGMTISGELMGSPMYMSPEQITSGRIPLDHRTDIYSLGASLYQLLTFQPPFDGQQRDQVLSQIIHKEPTRPRAVNKAIPKDLETICLKAMEKDPDRRYQTAKQMAEDLRHFVDRHAISARRIGPVERATRWARKNKALATMACLTLVVGLSASLFVYRAWNENRTMRREKAEEKALGLAMTGDLKGAIEAIESAKSYGAREDWALMLLGQVDLFEGKSADAVRRLEDAVSQGSKDSVMEHSILAQAYLADGQWKNYEQQVDKLLSMSAVTPRDQLFQGHAIYVHSTEKGLELMSSALKVRSDFQLGRVLRARARIYQALDRGDKNLLGDADLDLAVASESLKDNPLLSHARLYARLAAYSFSKRAGDTEKAKSDLDEAAADVRKLEEYPSFLFGNALRLYFHSFRTEWSEMERVMEDVIEHGNGGFVADAYLSHCFGARRNRDALKRLDRMSNQEDMYVLSSRTILLSETQADRERADAICSKLIQKYPQGDMSYVGWFLLGKQGDAIQAAKTYAKSMTVATERSFDKYKISYRGGEIDAKQFLELAGKSEQRLGQAYFHIGVRLLAERDRERALASFERSADTLIFHVTEVAWAQAFVKRMKDDPNWPEWLLVEPVDVDGE